MRVDIAEHPLLCADAFLCIFPQPLEQLPPSPEWQALLRFEAPAPIQSSDDVRTKVRQMLRWGGFKASGRSKPASEYLLKAHASGGITTINAAVDACNIASAHSGFPISVVDADLAVSPWRIAVAPAGTSYVFNPSGQELDLGGLVCLYDATGPSGSPVKDSQRTKTHGGTVRTLSVIWGEQSLAEHVAATGRWYRELLSQIGVQIEEGTVAAHA